MIVTVYGFSPSGNCHKVRLLLEQLGRAVPLGRSRQRPRARRARRNSSRRTRTARCRMLELRRRPRCWPNRTRSCAGSPTARRLPAGRCLAARAGAGVDVLRAVQPRALRRGRALHLRLDAGRLAAPRRTAAPARTRPPGAGGDGAPSVDAAVVHRRRATASPTSRCTPTPTSPAHGGFASTLSRRSATGWRACARRPASSRCQTRDLMPPRCIAQSRLDRIPRSLPTNAMPSNPIPARMKGVNRAEICDVNFQEFVRDWNGRADARPAPDEADPRRQRAATRRASASCSNRS